MTLAPSTRPASLPTGVIVVGSITADVTTFSAGLPRRGETILGDDATIVLGGKGANQAIASALAGANTYMVACVGDDLFTDLTRGGLAAKGVDVEHVAIVDGPTGIAHIRVDSTGENDIVMVPLANAKLDADRVEKAIADLAGRCSVLLTQLEVPSAVALRAITAAKKAGLTVVLDPAPAIPIDEAAWAFIDVVTPNETEASLITGIPVSDEQSAIAAGQWFCARGVTHAVITLASAGAVSVSAGGTERFGAFSVTAVDTTAAGDSFAGYLGAALSEGLSLGDSIPRAMAAGALAVTKRGASPSLPSRAEVERLMAEQRPEHSSIHAVAVQLN